jgi:acetyltransferase-like isoleucine patch superfamily enzyme
VRLEHDWLPLDLPDNVELAAGSYFHSAFAFLHYRSRRPTGVRIGRHTAVYETTMFDLGPAGEVEIGEYGVIYGPHFVGNSRITVGDFAYISYEVYLSDLPAPGLPAGDAPSSAAASTGGPAIVIGDDCWIGLRSVILAGARLGNGVIVGAGSVVDFEVPDHAIVAGNPARIVGHVTPGEGTRGTQHDWWAT